MKTIAMGAVSLLALMLAGAVQAQPAHDDAKFEALVNKAWDEDIARDPTRRTELTMTPSEATWTSVSDAARAAEAKRSADRLAALPKAVDRAKLSSNGRIRYDTYAATLHSDVVYERALREGYTTGGSVLEPATDSPRLMQNKQKIETAADAANYIARLRALPSLLDEVAAAGASRQARGIVLTKTGYTNLANQTRALGQGGPCGGEGENLMAKDFRAKLEKSKVPAAERGKLVAEADAALTSATCPAYVAFAAKAAAWAPSGRTSGMWEMPGGVQNYGDFIELALAERVDAEVIHQKGLQEVDKVEAEILGMAHKLGFKDLDGLRAHLRDNPKLTVPNTDAGYAELEAKAKADIDGMYKRLPEYFSYIPKSPMVIKRGVEGPGGGPPTPASFYIPAPLDGSQPAAYSLAFPPGPERIDAWNNSSVTYHEAVPGHHFQIATAMELQDGPDRIRSRFLSAYVEGWGLYAEQLANEMGVYENDDYGKIAWMQYRLERAVRLVLDTGLNAKGWTYDQGVAYQRAHLTNNLTINRFVNWPGQALGYYWGYLDILGAREHAQKELGAKFDIRGFHDAILRPGAMPPKVMREAVDAWIAKVKAG